MTHKKRIVSIISAILTLVIAMTMLMNTLSASAEEIDWQPSGAGDFTVISINSDIEASAGVVSYKPTTELTESDSIYTFKTNAHAAWLGEDDIGYAYNVFNVGNSTEDTLTIEATIEKPGLVGEGGELSTASSMGIMFRSGIENNASEIFLHVRPEGIMVVWRSMNGGRTVNRKSGNTITFPINLRMTKTGTTVICEYKTSTMSRYARFTPEEFSFSAPGPLCAGIAGHSNYQKVFNVAKFSNIKCYGVGTYDPYAVVSETSSSTSSVLEKIDPDLEVTDQDIVMYETFSDANLYDDKMTKGNYIWEIDEEENFKTENRNRYLYRNDLHSGAIYVGDDSWTDYKASVDVSFSDACDMDTENTNNIFVLYARSIKNVMYGYSDYAAVCRNITEKINGVNTNLQQIALYKRTNYREILGNPVQIVTVNNFYGDGAWHNLAISVFDNKISVFWDGNCLINEWTDTGEYCTTDVNGDFIDFTCNKGRVGLATIGTFVKIDNLMVRKLDDPIGGDFDNFIGDMWDEPIPSYIIDSIKNGINYNYWGGSY